MAEQEVTTINGKRTAQESSRIIVDAAFHAIAQHTLAGASMSRIAKEAGVSKPLLHYHFKTKEELLEKVLQEVMDRLLEIPRENVAGNLSSLEEIKAIFARYKKAITDEPDLLTVFYDFWVKGFKQEAIKEKIAQRFEAFRVYVGQLVSEGVAAGDFTPEKSHMIPPLMLSFLEGASLQLISDPQAFNYDLYQYMALEMIENLSGYKGRS